MNDSEATTPAPAPPPRPVFITAVSVAEQLGVSRATIYNLANQKLIGHVRVGDSIKFTQANVDEFLAANTVAPMIPTGRNRQ